MKTTNKANLVWHVSLLLKQKLSGFLSFVFICLAVEYLIIKRRRNGIPGADSMGGGRTRRAPPLKLEKNMIFLRKIVIFHTKYPQNFRASLRSARFFLSAPPPNLKSWIRPCLPFICSTCIWSIYIYLSVDPIFQILWFLSGFSEEATEPRVPICYVEIIISNVLRSPPWPGSLLRNICVTLTC